MLKLSIHKPLFTIVLIILFGCILLGVSYFFNPKLIGIVAFIIFFVAGSITSWYYQKLKYKASSNNQYQRSNDLFDQFFVNSIDMLCIADTKGHFVKLNQEWEKTLGYTLQELEGRKYIEFVHPDDIEKTIQISSSHTNNQKVISFINRYRHIDGSYRWIEWRSFRSEPYIYASARDITENKLSEKIIYENEEKFRIAFENAPTGMSIIKPDGRYVAVNSALCQMFGYTSEELLSGTINLITHPDDMERSYEWIKKMIAGDYSEPEFEKRYIHKDGHIVWGLVRAKWVYNDDGSPHISVTHIQDITKRKQIEEALKISEKKYRLLFENMTSGFALHEMIYDENNQPIDYRYIEANPAFGRLTGLPVASVIGKTIKEILPGIEEHWIETFGKVALTGNPMHYMNYTKDLGKYYETYVFSPEMNKFAVVFNDATERVIAENELKKSEEKFALAYKTSPDAVNINRLSDGLFIDTNNGFEAAIGYKSEELIGKSSYELNIWVNIKDRELLVKGLREFGKVTNLEAQFRRKDGTIITGLMSAAIINLQGEECILSLTRDITNLRMAEKELENAKALITTAFMQTPMPMVVANAKDGKILMINGACEDILGIKDEPTYIGQLVKNLNRTWQYFDEFNNPVPLDQTPLFLSLQGNEIKSKEYCIKRKDGTTRWASISSSSVRSNSGEIIAAYLVLSEITERKLHEYTVRTLNETLEKKVLERTIQLQQANKDLEAFAYSVSHDLRAPLRHIGGFSKLLYSGIQNPAESITNYYNKIELSTKRMSTIIDDLLTFSRLGRKEMNITSVNLFLLIHEIIEHFRPDQENRIINWRINELPEIMGDKNLLRIVFENLISNAIKYTSKKPRAFIEIGANNKENNSVEIYITDNGEGFDMVYSKKLFGVFQRLHPNEEFEGTGIGLANVKQIILKHNGNVRAEGKINEGATFYITLPK